MKSYGAIWVSNLIWPGSYKKPKFRHRCEYRKSIMRRWRQRWGWYLYKPGDAEACRETARSCGEAQILSHSSSGRKLGLWKVSRSSGSCCCWKCYLRKRMKLTYTLISSEGTNSANTLISTSSPQNCKTNFGCLRCSIRGALLGQPKDRVVFGCPWKSWSVWQIDSLMSKEGITHGFQQPP